MFLHEFILTMDLILEQQVICHFHFHKEKIVLVFLDKMPRRYSRSLKVRNNYSPGGYVAR
jgi:hypothetical protein